MTSPGPHLVEFGQHKKVIHLEEDTLENKLCELFNLKSGEFFVQEYNSLFEEYVDRESINDDLPHHAKLRIVQRETCKATEPLMENILMSPNKDTSPKKEDIQVIQDERNKRHAAQREPLPWPVKFKLPVCNFPVPLKKALEAKERLPPKSDSKRALVNAAFEEMLKYTVIPTQDQYAAVAQSIIVEYPHLADKGPTRKPYGTWSACLSEKFRNERRNGKLPKAGPTPKKTKKDKKDKVEDPNKWGATNFTQDRYEGEDDASQTEHVKYMQKNATNARRDESKIKRLMNLTFPDRRQLINKGVSIKATKEAYPCLFSYSEMAREFTRLTEKDADKVFLENIAPVANKMAANPSKPIRKYWNDVKEKLKKISRREARKNMVIAATLMSLNRSFREEKQDYILVDENANVPKDCATPVIISKGDPLEESCSFDIYAEGEYICSPIDIMQAFALLISTYYVFNIAYNKKCYNTLTFLQRHVMKLPDKSPVPPAVQGLINKLLSKET